MELKYDSTIVFFMLKYIIESRYIYGRRKSNNRTNYISRKKRK
jgi:hypothetical protein